ncbi:copper resistance CopC family protein [Cellulomonas hominis]
MSTPTAAPRTADARRPTWSRGLAVGLLALPVLLGTLLLGAGAAQAHNTLQSTDPADGSTVATAPERVTLTFDEPAQSLGTELVVLAPDGSTVSTGAAVLDGTSVSQALTGALPAGTYTVQWRVTSADGHPLSGELTFMASAGTTVGAVSAPDSIDPAAPAEPEPTATPQESPEPIMTTLATPAPEQAATETATETAQDDDTALTAGAVVGIVVAALALVAVVVVVVRERRKSTGS